MQMPEMSKLLSPDCEDCLDDVVVGEGTCSIEYHRDLLSNLLSGLSTALAKEEAKQAGAQPLEGPWWSRPWLPSKLSVLRRLIHAHRTVLSSQDASMHWSFPSLSSLVLGDSSSNSALGQLANWAFKLGRQSTDSSPRQWLERLLFKPAALWTSLKNASGYQSVLALLKHKFKAVKRSKAVSEGNDGDESSVHASMKDMLPVDVLRMFKATIETYDVARVLVHGVSGIHFSCAENGAGFHMVATGMNITQDPSVLPDLVYI